MNFMRLIVAVSSVALLAGCAMSPRHATEETVIAIPMPEPRHEMTGSIYQARQGIALFEDVKARQVGDLITVVLSEQTSATKSATTNTSKDNSIEVANPTIFGAPLSFGLPGGNVLPGRDLTLEANLSSTKTFAGAGDSAQSNKLTGNITAFVTEVLANGNLRIEGGKTITINKGDEYVKISGVIRPIDIRTDNSVLSTQIANAKIAYGGKGIVADSNEAGWLARFFNSGWWPF